MICGARGGGMGGVMDGVVRFGWLTDRLID